jgi:hypothetical protein
MNVPRVLLVPVAHPEVVAITGVVSSEKEARVEFTWKLALTAIGQKFK